MSSLYDLPPDRPDLVPAPPRPSACGWSSPFANVGSVFDSIWCTGLMRRTLILGGTGWLGKEIASQLVARGEAVTCLARGESGDAPVGATLIRADRTAAGAYDLVASQEWDDVIELTYDPGLVEGALGALRDRASHWTLVSSVSVYASNSEPEADETAALVDATELENVYGRAKVAAERAASKAVGDRLLIARPGLIGGPGDPSDRFGYWIARLALAQGGPVLVPDRGELPLQVIDVRDVASWIVAAGHESLTGTFNVVGNQHTLAEVIKKAATLANYSGLMVEASESWLVEHGVNYWAGARSLPLWLPWSEAAHGQRSSAAFRQARGKMRSIEETLADTLEDERRRGLGRARKSGLTRQEELDLLSELS